jgi:hypothetical protein
LDMHGVPCFDTRRAEGIRQLVEPEPLHNEGVMRR